MGCTASQGEGNKFVQNDKISAVTTHISHRKDRISSDFFSFPFAILFQLTYFLYHSHKVFYSLFWINLKIFGKLWAIWRWKIQNTYLGKSQNDSSFMKKEHLSTGSAPQNFSTQNFDEIMFWRRKELVSRKHDLIWKYSNFHFWNCSDNKELHWVHKNKYFILSCSCL